MPTALRSLSLLALGGIVALGCSDLAHETVAPTTLAATESTTTGVTTIAAATSSVPPTARAAPTTTTFTLPPTPSTQARVNLPSMLPDGVTSAGWLSIPEIKLRVEMINWLDPWSNLDELDHGPGHWIGTAEPGQWGNVVIGGHRTTQNHEFMEIDQLQPGSRITIMNEFGEPFTYAVTESFTITPDELWVLDDRGGATLTLFTCHPRGSTAERLIVFGDLVG